MPGDVMNPTEIAERWAKLEARFRTLGAIAAAALVAASAALVLAFYGGLLHPPSRGIQGLATVEASRFVLRDRRGAVRALLEVTPAGDTRLTLGDDLGKAGAGGSAVGLGVGPNIVPQLSLRKGGGDARASLTAGQGLVLWSGGQGATGLMTLADGSSYLQLTDAQHRVYRLPAASSFAPVR